MNGRFRDAGLAQLRDQGLHECWRTAEKIVGVLIHKRSDQGPIDIALALVVTSIPFSWTAVGDVPVQVGMGCGMPHDLSQKRCSHWFLGRVRGVCGDADADRWATGPWW